MEFFTDAIGLTTLATALNSGEVDTLVILGANPVYSAPPDLNWTQAQAKTKSVVRLGYHEDETFEASKRADDWHFPLAHYLESWGDALTSDRTLVPIQPLIQPLFGGLTELEVLARIAGESVTSPYEIVRATFANYRPAGVISASSPDQRGTEVTEDTWRKFLYGGFHTGSKPSEFGDGAGAIDPDEVARIVGEVKANTPSKENLEVIFHRDYSVDDGCYANNGWLQELPDPITKISWDNAVLMSRKTARELGLKNEDVIEVKLGNRTVSGPVWIQPGMADYSLGLALGYGREKAGRVGTGVGFNAYALRSSETEHIAVGATVRKT